LNRGDDACIARLTSVLFFDCVCTCQPHFTLASTQLFHFLTPITWRSVACLMKQMKAME